MRQNDKQSQQEDWLKNSNLFSRRSFLKSSAILAGSVAGSSALTGCSANEVVPGLKVLTPMEKKLFEKLTQVCLPTQGSILVSPEGVPIIANIDHLYSLLDAKIRGDLKAAASLFEYGSTVIGFHFKPFTKLNNEEAIAYIEKWQTGATIQRGISTALKKLVYSSYWREDATWPPLSYDGPVSDKWGLVPQGNSPLPE